CRAESPDQAGVVAAQPVCQRKPFGAMTAQVQAAEDVEVQLDVGLGVGGCAPGTSVADLQGESSTVTAETVRHLDDSVQIGLIRTRFQCPGDIHDPYPQVIGTGGGPGQPGIGQQVGQCLIG